MKTQRALVTLLRELRSQLRLREAARRQNPRRDDPLRPNRPRMDPVRHTLVKLLPRPLQQRRPHLPPEHPRLRPNTLPSQSGSVGRSGGARARDPPESRRAVRQGRVGWRVSPAARPRSGRPCSTRPAPDVAPRGSRCRLQRRDHAVTACHGRRSVGGVAVEREEYLGC